MLWSETVRPCVTASSYKEKEGKERNKVVNGVGHYILGIHRFFEVTGDALKRHGATMCDRLFLFAWKTCYL